MQRRLCIELKYNLIQINVFVLLKVKTRINFKNKSDLELPVRWVPLRNLIIGLNYLSLVFLDLYVSTLSDFFKASTNKDHFSSLNA